MSFHPLSTETIKFWQATNRGASTGSHSTLTRPFFLVSDSLRGSVVGFGAPGGPRPPETPGQSQSRKRRHYSHPPVWPVRRGVRQRGRFRGPCFGGAGAGQVLSRQRRGRLNSRQAPRGGPCLRLRCCRRRRRRCRCSGCWGGSVRGGAVACLGESVCIAVFVWGVFIPPSLPDSRGVEGESLRTPGHAAEMPLFATNPFDQDVGKSFCRSLSSLSRSASPPCPLSAAFLSPWPGLNASLFLRLLPEEFGEGWGLGSSRNGTQRACEVGLRLGLWVSKELL